MVHCLEMLISSPGKVRACCVVPANMYGLKMVSLSEHHQHRVRLQVCQNNWIRRVAGVKRIAENMVLKSYLRIGK